MRPLSILEAPLTGRYGGSFHRLCPPLLTFLPWLAIRHTCRCAGSFFKLTVWLIGNRCFSFRKIFLICCEFCSCLFFCRVWPVGSWRRGWWWRWRRWCRTAYRRQCWQNFRRLQFESCEHAVLSSSWFATFVFVVVVAGFRCSMTVAVVLWEILWQPNRAVSWIERCWFTVRTVSGDDCEVVMCKKSKVLPEQHGPIRRRWSPFL